MTTSYTLFGFARKKKFFSYDELEDVSAATVGGKHTVRLTTHGKTESFMVPRVEVGNYLVACALEPPKRERLPATAYR